MSQRSYPDISRHGLTRVFDPASDNEAVAHIIFVHGLFGNPEKTWTGQLQPSNSPPPKHRDENLGSEGGDVQAAENRDSRGRGIFWPALLLPEIVDNVQISTWGYDADIDDFWASASQNTVGQHATNLLSDIADMLESSQPILPIIFVVHSLGGIVVKAAMNQSSETRGTRLKVVIPNVIGIVFLGTPHRGSKSASIGRMAYQITTIATRKPNRKLLRALEKNSDTLEQIGNSFLQTLEGHPSIEVYSFREEKETRRFLVFNTIIVEPDSAKIGLAKEEVNSIPKSHSNMTKFSSLEDVGFKRVSAQVRRWVRALPRHDDNTFDPKYNDLISSLAAPATWARIKGVLPSHPKTFQWLYDRQVVTFSDWLQSPGRDCQPIYWIQGLPGSGKSTLMKFAMLDRRTSDLLDSEDRATPHYVLAGFFFHDRGSTIQKSISGMFQGLLYSILSQALKLRVFVQPIYAQLVETHQSKTPKWDPESLELAFEAILQQREVTTRLCLFLDAFDEHHGDNEELVSLMSRLVSHTDRDCVKIKICIASRPWDTFVNNFSKCPGFKIHEHTFNDILEYASSTIHKASPVDLREESSPDARSAKLDALADQIAKMAYGVFIWVRIVVEEIANGVRSRTPLFVLEETLAHMPKELKDLYEHTLERIETGHAEEAFVMLQIALCALSPLPLVTFLNATSFTVWGKYSAPDEESENDMIRRVVSRSGGLLEVVTGSVGPSAISDPPIPGSSIQFIHQTVKEYIHERKDNFGLKRFETGGNGFEYLFKLAAVCWEDWANDIGDDAFEYATLARLADTPMDILTEALSSLITPRHNNLGETTTRLDWWLKQKDSEPQIRFYTHELFTALRAPRYRLFCLAFAAGFEFSSLRDGLLLSDEAISGDSPIGVLWDMLLCIATIGPQVTDIPNSRKNMLSDLLNFLILDTFSGIRCFIPEKIRTDPGPLGVRPDALVLLILTKGIYGQDEIERVSAIRFLLEHGSDPNSYIFLPSSSLRDRTIAMPGSFSTSRDLPSTVDFSITLFEQVIKQESAQIVRLFGDYGAKVPDHLLDPISTFWRRLPKPSDVLEEVLRILFRDYPNFEEVRIHNKAGAVALCGIIGMSVGVGVPIFRRALPEGDSRSSFDTVVLPRRVSRYDDRDIEYGL